jgi:TonB-linked SusC/RagA family outer membrane protein
MKLILFFLLLSSNLVWARQTYAQATSLNLELTNVPLEEVFDAIRRQSEFEFFYNNDQVNTAVKVNVNAKNADINAVLEQVLPAIYEYKINDRYILINKRKEIAPALSPQPQPQQAKKTITGTVIDKEGETIIGANIVEKGSAANGTITDVDGKFTLNVSDNAVLQVSYVGYITQEIKIERQTVLYITLQEDSQTLDEMVVVGYGTQRKVSVVAAITTIEPAKLKTGTSRSLSNNLVGNLGGIIGVQRSGEPGYDNSQFWIRGISTFAGNTTPLVLVDGIERSLNNIDVQEIESLSVLKDASASAVYGVRGSNGVILITTKRGKIGKPVVNIQVEHAVTAPVQLPEFFNSYESLSLLNDINMQQYGQYWMDPATVEKYRTGYDPELYPDVNWTDAVMKDFASNTRTTLDVNGGTELLRYSFVAAHYHENGLIERDKTQEWDSSVRLNRFNLRANVDMNVTKTTLLRLSIGGFLQKRISPPLSINDLFGDYWGTFATPPYVHPTRYASGEFVRVNGGANPWVRATQTGYRRGAWSQLESVFSLEQDIAFIPGLKARAIFSFDNYSQNSVQRYKDPDHYNPASERDPETGKLILAIQSEGQEFLGHAVETSYGNNSTYLEGSFVYDRIFGKHAVNGLLLYNQRDYDNGDKLPYRNQGFAGRAAYTYSGRYITEFNFGYNGSENFARGQRFGFFPSIAAGWILSEEPFMIPLHNVFSKIKLRASHGLAGNDNLGGRRFAYITTISTINGYTWGTNDAKLSRTGRTEGDIGVSNLTWETVAKTNLGIEIELWKALELQVDVFKERRRNIFMQRQNFPRSAGFVSYPWANFGKVDNQGFETTLILNKQINNDWAISARATATYAANKVIERDEAPGVRGTTRSAMGKPINQLWGYVADGLFTEDDFEDLELGILKEGIPLQLFAGRVNPGDIKYIDQNGDGKITALDQTAIGGTLDPQFVYGFAASINFKNIDFAFLFQGNALTDRIIGTGNDFLPGAQMGARGNIYSNARDSWTVENPRQDAFYPRLYMGINTNNNQLSTWWLKDMSMLRLKNLEVGYSLPQLWTNRMSVNHARIYLRGTNLLCFSNFKLWDPELNSIGNSGSAYPMMRSVSVGLDITFK